MGNKRTEILSDIFCLVAGMLLIVFSRQVNVLNWIVIVLGILFLVPSLISIISICIPPKDSGMPRPWYMMVPAAAGLILGALMICLPGDFVNLLTWLFAIVLIVFGVYRIAVEISLERIYNTSKAMLIVPVIIAVTGIVIICLGPEKLQQLAALITGIGLVLYAVNGLVAYMHLQSRKRQMQMLNQSISEDVDNYKNNV